MSGSPKPVRMVPIGEDGRVDLPQLPDAMRQNVEGTAAFYQAVGFQPPWIGYVSVADGRPVGGGAFKGAPAGGRVEIAYYTLPELEGQGWATATAQALVEIARSADRELVVAAQTLPLRSASTSLLEKLGFALHGSVMHPEDGEVWEWRLRQVLATRSGP